MSKNIIFPKRARVNLKGLIQTGFEHTSRLTILALFNYHAFGSSYDDNVNTLYRAFHELELDGFIESHDVPYYKVLPKMTRYFTLKPKGAKEWGIPYKDAVFNGSDDWPHEALLIDLDFSMVMAVKEANLSLEIITSVKFKTSKSRSGWSKPDRMYIIRDLDKIVGVYIVEMARSQKAKAITEQKILAQKGFTDFVPYKTNSYTKDRKPVRLMDRVNPIFLHVLYPSGLSEFSLARTVSDEIYQKSEQELKGDVRRYLVDDNMKELQKRFCQSVVETSKAYLDHRFLFREAYRIHENILRGWKDQSWVDRGNKKASFNRPKLVN